MKNQRYLYTLLIGLSVLFLAFVAPYKFIPDNIYRITKSSKLEINGNTNINSFSCYCTDEIDPQIFYIEHSENRHTYRFDKTVLKININSLDCGNKLMNKDLQKSLHADKYPFIEIKLLEIKEDNCNPLNEFKDWVKIKALTNISLNGNTKEYEFDITAKKYSANKFRFIGTKPILMSDFCVEPPTALMGMVKVQNEIKINLDLEIMVGN